MLHACPEEPWLWRGLLRHVQMGKERAETGRRGGHRAPPLRKLRDTGWGYLPAGDMTKQIATNHTTDLPIMEIWISQCSLPCHTALGCVDLVVPRQTSRPYLMATPLIRILPEPRANRGSRSRTQVGICSHSSGPYNLAGHSEQDKAAHARHSLIEDAWPGASGQGFAY